jgi:FixJ family two-component response regulator
MAPNATLTKSPLTLQPRVLVVDDEPTLVELMDEIVSRSVDCRIVRAGSIHEARRILESQPIELMVADVNLPDGAGMSLLPALRKSQPSASAIVITGAPSVDGAISALRHGALDFVPKPFSAEQIVDRVRKALARQAAAAKTDRRLNRLREAVRRLNEARKVVSKKVDLLCNDLISAYGDLAKQLDTVRTQEGFRQYVSQATDLEQLLCHSMDWMLRQMGYCNVAIWLASEENDFQLGAYMKYTIDGEADLTEAMKRGVVPQTLQHGLLQLNGEAVQERLTPAELDYLADQSILAVNCTYLGESLAVVVLFRDDREAFTEEDGALLKQISALLAVSLAETVRKAQGGTGEENPFYDGEGGSEPHRDGKPDAADWWKRGEEPPF